MYYIIARECEIAQVIVDYVHMQKKQHEEALLHLNETLPQLNSLILVNPMKPMFCQPLEEHLALIGCKIAFPIELCTRALCQVRLLGNFVQDSYTTITLRHASRDVIVLWMS